MTKNIRKYFISSLMTLLIPTLSFCWQMHPGSYQDVFAIACNENESKIIIGQGDGGFWITNDGCETWEPINDRVLPAEASNFYPSVFYEINMLDANGDTIIAKYRCDRNLEWAYSISTTGGLNWQKLNAPGTNRSCDYEFMKIDPLDHSHFLYVNNMNYSYSHDFSDSWLDTININEASGKSDFELDLSCSDTLYITGIGHHLVNSGISVSHNGGLDWFSPVNFAQQFGFSIVLFNKIVPLSNNEVITFMPFALRPDSSAFPNYQFRSQDAGQTWQNEGNVLPHNFEVTDGKELSGYPGRVLLTNGGLVYSTGIVLSEDYGQTYRRITESFADPYLSIYTMSENIYSGTVYVCAAGHGVYKTLDGGLTWEKKNLHLPFGRKTRYEVNEGILSISGFYDHLSEYFDFETNTWVQQNNYGNTADDDSIIYKYPIHVLNDDSWLRFDIIDDNNSNFNRTALMKSTDHGDSWSEFANLGSISSVSKFFGDSLCRFIYNEITDEGILFKVSVDTGMTFIENSIWPVGTQIGQISQSEEIVFAYIKPLDSEPDIYMSVDNCREWSRTHFPNTNELSFSPNVYNDSSSGLAYLFTGAHCFQYDGNSWEQLGMVSSIYDAAIIPNGDFPIIVGSTYGSHRLNISEDGGYTWTRLDSTLPYSRQIAYIGNTVYDPWRGRIWISTSLGMMYAEREDLLSVDDPGSAFIPLEANPLQAYPNPFNSSVNITYTIESKGQVELKLYNISGQEIASLYSGNRNRGSYELTYDASHLASGTYFLKLNESGTIHTQKVTLVK